MDVAQRTRHQQNNRPPRKLKQRSMTAVAKPEQPLIANRHVSSIRAPLPEQELIRLLESVKALRKDLRLIFASNRETALAVKAGHDLLKSWNDVLDRILSARQTSDTCAQLDAWNNEGGASCPTPQPDPINTTDGDKRPSVFAAVDSSMAAGKP